MSMQPDLFVPRNPTPAAGVRVRLPDLCKCGHETMTAIQIKGAWFVIAAATVMAGPFETNAQAWRWIDRQTGSPISRSEVVAEWLFEQQMDRGT
jgi:hypothetical protein